VFGSGRRQARPEGHGLFGVGAPSLRLINFILYTAPEQCRICQKGSRYQGVEVVDYEKEIMRLRGEVAALRADVNNLVGWQHTQNGTIQNVDNKITGIYKIMIGTAGTAALSFLGTIITLLVVLSTRGGQ
jgi:hypothetical protein